jgi:AAA domain
MSAWPFTDSDQYGTTDDGTEPARELDAFLAEPDPEYDWLIPEVLERGDRLILTAPEGAGKSTLLRQIGVQVASGIHPFTLEKIPPVRVLLLDLENSPRQVRRSLRPLRLAAGDRYHAEHLHVVVDPAGMDLFGHAADRDRLAERIRTSKAEMLIAGPLYKLAAGDPTLEEVAKQVSGALDRLRADHDVAAILEAHTPHAVGGGRRPTRPYGASLWLRWPEFGKHLDPGGRITDWRGPRDERTWPRALKRGGAWPWTVPEADAGDVDQDLAELPPAAVKVLAVLRGPREPMTVRELGDGIRSQLGRPLKRQTIQQYLNLLADYGFADGTGEVGKPKSWWAIPPKPPNGVSKSGSAPPVRNVSTPAQGVLSDG